MVRKLFVLVLLVVVCVMIWWQFISVDAGQTKEVVAVVELVDTVKKPDDVVPQIDTQEELLADGKKTKELTHTELEKTEQSILEELKTRQYSDDPIVEMESVVFQHFQCLPDFESLVFFAQNQTTTALNQVKTARSVCADFKKKFPIISDVDQFRKHKEALVPSSKYGRLKKNRDLSRTPGERMTDEVLAAVATQSGPIIAGSGLSFRYGARYELVTSWFEELKSSDQLYTAYITTLATLKLSCQFQNGVSCGSNSFFMLQKCVSDERYCGVDFETWYQQATLPGQRKDVEIVIAYLNKKSVSDE